MSRPDKNKDNAYARNLAAGMGQHEAYLAAGFKGMASAACTKANTPEMRIKVDAIRDQYISHLIIDQKWVTKERVKTYFRAVDAGDNHVCQKVLKDLGANLGMDVRRAEISIHASYERKSDSELLQELKDVMVEASQQLQITDQSEGEE